MSEHRILLIENPAHLSIELGRLKIERAEHEAVYVAPHDIAVLVLHDYTISLTHAVLNLLAQSGTVVLSTDQKHMPSAMQIPLDNNVQMVSRLEAQISLRDSNVPEEIWRQLVSARLASQAFLLQQQKRPGVELLKRLAKNVTPGDKENLESQGARHFWKHWLETPHKRNKQNAKDNINACLNFGYAILRSCIARAVTATGLNPALGIHHCSRENSCNLVDDLIEPYRYLVEQCVIDSLLDSELNASSKQQLANIVTRTVRFTEKEYRFPAAVQETVDSFVRVLKGEKNRLALPSFHFE